MRDKTLSYRHNNCRNRCGIVLLITLVLLVMLSTLGYTLSIRVAAQRHRDRRNDRVQSARRGDPNADDIVGERPKHVLADRPYDDAGEANRPGQPLQIVRQQADVGGVAGEVGAATHRDAHIRGGQRRRIVDPVADHRHDARVVAGGRHLGDFVLW